MDREGMVMIGKSGGPKCGRWNPTPEQVRVLTDLFRSGLRTPTTDQIQNISSHLSSFGKIESKNVFYWFQNHKARERQHHCKKRRRQSPPSTTSSSSSSSFRNTPTIGKTEAGPAVTSSMAFGTNQFGGGESEVETLELFPLSSHGDHPRKDSRETTACRRGGKDFLLDLRLSF